MAACLLAARSGKTDCGSREGDGCMDHEPEEDLQLQEPEEKEEGQLTLIDPETFYDLLMEQQEQM